MEATVMFRFDARASKLAGWYASLSEHVGDQGKNGIGSDADSDAVGHHSGLVGQLSERSDAL
jgi:hypothetical protein